MELADRFATGLIDRRRLVIALLAVLLLGVGTGVAQLEESDGIQEFEIGSQEEAKLEYVESNFSSRYDEGEIAQIVLRDENVLDAETLVGILELQRSLESNETVATTLSGEPRTVSVANVLATAAIRQRNPEATSPTIEQQIAAIEAMDRDELEAVIRQVLSGGSADGTAGIAFMPNHYEAGTSAANATMIVAFQHTEREIAPANAPDRIVDSQLAMQALSADAEGAEEVMVVGSGIITAETEQSREDTFAIVGPVALLFVLLTLVVVYRDLLDIGLSLLGIVLVQLWTFGWLGIQFNAILIAIPVLLIGLSIDYGIHVFMRYRERREAGGESPARSMQRALAGVGVALLWVTVTTVVGFLSNVASPVRPIQELGVISAIGIVGALVVFGVFVPPLKVELDTHLQRVGFERDQRAIGTGSGRVGRLLSIGSAAARRAPVAVLVVAVLVTLVATAGATQVSTSFEPEDNIAESAPAWTEHLPSAMEPGEYTVKENLRYANDRFVRHDATAELLVEGAITDPAVLQRLERAQATAGEQPVAVTLANGQPRILSPLSVMQRVAAESDEFRSHFVAADTDGDGVPDRNLAALYDALYETAPDRAGRVIHRSDGNYLALRLSVSVEPDAEGAAVTDQMGAVAAELDGEDVSVTATGDPIVTQLIQDYLLETLWTSLVVTLLVVGAILAAMYRVVHGSATLGVVTLLPVGIVVSWIVGTMYAIGYPLSVLTTIVASITVGIGIDYSIHVSERFRSELENVDSIHAALAATTRGTGSALFGSAVTTAAGFGVLGFALHPSLQQFGTITAIMIVYAFLASVLVLPSLLVIWARYVGPETISPADATDRHPRVESIGD